MRDMKYEAWSMKHESTCFFPILHTSYSILLTKTEAAI
jgi:hypothetical protein